jgi:tartrate-resistant acid phosphatase type 5
MKVSRRSATKLAAAALVGAQEIVFASPARATEISPAAAALDDEIIARLKAASLPALADALPEPLRAQAKTMVESTDAEARALAGNRIADEAPAVEFLLAWLTHDHPVKETRYTLMNIYAYPHFTTDPRTPAVLRHLILTSPEPELVAESAKQWRAVAVRGIEQAVTARLAATRASGSPALHEALLPMEDWARNLRAGANMPTFLRRPIPPFKTSITGDRARIVAFGDFGTGSKGQTDVAAEIRHRHARTPFDLGITLGDNFYPQGLSTLDDPRWQTQFEELYGPLKIDFHPSLGNHDRSYDADSGIAEIMYTHKGGPWKLPSSFYTYTAGPAQWFAIDTVEMSEIQLRWLAQSLDASTARWKIVYGHYPIIIANPNYLEQNTEAGESMRRRLAEMTGEQKRNFERAMNGEQADMYDRLLPVLKGRADLYLAGHHHSLEHLKPQEGVNLFIIGGGGATSYPVNQAHPRAFFAKSVYGFADITVTPTVFTLAFIDQQGQEIYKTTLDKPAVSSR